MMRVAVCIVTYQRPQGLKRLLTGLSALHFRGEPPEVSVIVVDNDADGSARAVCDAVRADLPWPLRYDIEPQRGIPFARNKAIQCALDEAEFVAFIDDDESPDPQWLDELLVVQAASGADVVTGPVVPELPCDAPAWVRHGRFFDRTQRPTGTRLDRAFTGNVLIRAAVLHQFRPWFDERLALSGGSDRHFFSRLHRSGRPIVWADNAVVQETIPPSRLSAKWLIQRFFRTGNTACFAELDLAPSLRTALLQFAKGVAWVLIGLFWAPTGMVTGRTGVVRAAQFAAYGAGILAGLVGFRNEEYRTTHGT